MKKLLFAAIATVLASSAGAMNYVCDIRDTGDGRGFMVPVVGIELRPETNSAYVIDGLIDHVKGEPIRATLKDRGNGKYRIIYRVNNIPATPTYADVTYRLTLDTRKKTLLIRGSLAATTNTIAGRGACKPGKLVIQ